MFREKLFQTEYSGVYTIDLPRFLDAYRNVKYRFTLEKPPRLDAIQSNELNVFLELRCELAWGTRNSSVFSVDAELITRPDYDLENEELDLNILDVQVTSIEFRKGASIPGVLLDIINNVLDSILKQSPLSNMEKIPLLSLVSRIDLPQMPQSKISDLRLYFEEIQIISDRVILIGFNMGKDKRNSLLVDNSGGEEVSLTVTEEALNKVLSHWWRYTTHPKTEKIAGSVEVMHLDTLMNHVSNISFELGSKVASLGLLESDLNIERAWVDYQGQMRMDSPSIALNMDHFKVKGRLIVDLDAALKIEVRVESKIDTSSFIPDRLTPWKDDRVLKTSKRVYTVQRLQKKRLDIDLSDMKASIIVGEDGGLGVNLTEFDAGLEIDWNIPRRLKKRLESSLESSVIGSYPVLPFNSSLFSNNFDGTEVKYTIRPLGVSILDESVIIRIDVDLL